MNSFTYGGVSSETLGFYVGGQKTFGSPQRDVTKIAIPGRNGELVRDNGRYFNISVAYNIVAMDDFVNRAKAARNEWNRFKGYQRLSDTYDPTHYRMARMDQPIDFETSAYNATGKAQIVFDCKPQRFLTSGETFYTLSSGQGRENPTYHDALPLFYCSGFTTGATLTVENANGTYTLETASPRSYATYIDCELQDVYYGSANLNNLVSGDFPVLAPGTNTFIFSGFTQLMVRPRWWEL